MLQTAANTISNHRLYLALFAARLIRVLGSVAWNQSNPDVWIERTDSPTNQEKREMKNKIHAVMFAAVGALAMTASAQAVTLSGTGCSKWGTASYLYVNAGSSLVLINGAACFANGLTAGEQAALSAVVSQAQASGKQVAVGTGASLGGGTANGLSVAMQ